MYFFSYSRTSPCVPPVPPKRQGSHLSTSSASSVTAQEASAHDQVRVWALEDTPLNFSTATSLSDLTVDEAPNSGRVSVDSQDGLIQHHPTIESQPPTTHRYNHCPLGYCYI